MSKYHFAEHILDGPGLWKGPSPNQSGTLVAPRLLVYHYTASGGTTGAGDVDFFKTANAKASAHFVIGRSGDLAQVVALNKKAWHAGVSSWKGVANCNDFSIGIELDNWGWLSKGGDGQYRSHKGAVIPADQVVKARHKNPSCTYEYWEAYPAAQIATLIELTLAIKEAYPIQDIAGHEDIAPGRKIDPGPAFPWSHVLAEVQGNKDAPGKTRQVVVSKLNVRGGPGTTFNVVGQVKAGDYIQEVANQGDWCSIIMPNGKPGWVFRQYIK